MIGIASVLALLSLAADARGGQPTPAKPRVAFFSSRSCTAETTSRITRVLRVEMGSLLATDPQLASENSDRITVSCRKESAVVVVERPGLGWRDERVLFANALPPNSLPRVAALAAIELLSALARDAEDVEATVGPKPPPPSLGAAPTTERTIAVAARPSGLRWELRAFSARRQFFAEDSGLRGEGVGAAIARRFHAPWILTFDSDVLWGNRSQFIARPPPKLGLGAGPVDEPEPSEPMQESATCLGGSLSGSLGAGGAVGAVRYEGGVGWRLGLARLTKRSSVIPGAMTLTTNSGTPDTQAGTRFWSGPTVSAKLGTGVQRLLIDVGLEMGWAVTGTDTGSVDAGLISLRGPWFGLHMGMGLRL